MKELGSSLDELFSNVNITNKFEELKKDIVDKTVISDSNAKELIQPTDTVEEVSEEVTEEVTEEVSEEVTEDLISSVNSQKTLPDEISESDVLISTHNSDMALPNDTPISTVNANEIHEKPPLDEYDLISSHNTDRFVEKED